MANENKKQNQSSNKKGGNSTESCKDSTTNRTENKNCK